MESATPLNTGLIESEETLRSRRGSLVSDDRTIYDELIAPMEAAMMRSIWRIVRNVDLAEDTLQDALAIIWKKRFADLPSLGFQHDSPSLACFPIIRPSTNSESFAFAGRRRRHSRLRRVTIFSDLSSRF